MARIAASLAALLFVVAARSAAGGSDYGPPVAVAAIRHDLPLLLAHGLGGERRSFIDWVVADERGAVAMWHAGVIRGIVILRNYGGRWWWRAGTMTINAKVSGWTPLQSPGDRITACGSFSPWAPSAHELLEQGFISPHLAKRLTLRLKPPQRPKTLGFVICDYAPNYVNDEGNVYDAIFHYSSGLFGEAWVLALSGGMPSPKLPNEGGSSKAYYSFDLWSQGDKALTFPDGSTFKIWFPYVLRSRLGYTLTVTNVSPVIRRLSGKFEDNALTFTLPWFTLPPYGAAHGEINGPE